MQPETPNPKSKIEKGLVSVIVVNWNGLAYLGECLDSIEGQSYLATELLVIDNGSTDGSRPWLQARCGEKWRLIELASNLGFAGGVNAGIRASQGEFVALLNNDAVADSNWLANLAACMENPEVGMAASKILFYEQRQIIDKVGHLLYPDGLNRGRGAGDVDRGQHDRSDDVFFPDGCAALYRRSMLEDIGMFDEQFFAYGDDADLGLRARWRGWICRYAPEAKVYHRHSRSLGKYSPQKAFLVERNRLWVAVKLFPMPLLLISPLFTLWRFFWHLSSILRSRGLAGGVTREYSAGSLFVALVRAYLSGLQGLGEILRKRRMVFRSRRITYRQFYALLHRYRISARDLALRD
ncbi:MAG: glycosyltransferase family 2 protein [Acidobacteriia bacterium]|nr:glycosyltransferase family 2 protein [Terriglobia bacterium]